MQFKFLLKLLGFNKQYQKKAEGHQPKCVYDYQLSQKYTQIIQNHSSNVSNLLKLVLFLICVGNACKSFSKLYLQKYKHAFSPYWKICNSEIGIKISCLNFWDEAWWFLSFRAFGTIIFIVIFTFFQVFVEIGSLWGFRN